MHRLLAHRGEEVTDDIIDSENSVVWDQAENRMWTQMSLLYHLIE
jgi:ornithine carbamoyltransferase